MEKDLNKLQELIEKGKDLKNSKKIDGDDLKRWSFAVDEFLDTYYPNESKRVTNQLNELQNIPPDYIGTRNNLEAVLAFLQSLH